MGILAGALGLYLLITGSIPIGRSPFFFGSVAATLPILIRISGLLILVGLFIPTDFIVDGFTKPIILSAGLLVLFIGMIASLSGRAR